MLLSLLAATGIAKPFPRLVMRQDNSTSETTAVIASENGAASNTTTAATAVATNEPDNGGEEQSPVSDDWKSVYVHFWCGISDSLLMYMTGPATPAL